jgi:uncharacterized protein YegL
VRKPDASCVACGSAAISRAAAMVPSQIKRLDQRGYALWSPLAETMQTGEPQNDARNGGYDL